MGDGSPSDRMLGKGGINRSPGEGFSGMGRGHVMPVEDSSSSVSRRSWVSLVLLLVFQTQNAFNDNFVRFVVMGLAMAAAAGSMVGDNIEFILATMITTPFILLAPVAGYLSDRFSKRDVLLGCLFLQLALFFLLAAAVAMRSVELAVFGFFLLAVQSTLFSPAKLGILKELVGSRRLGFANGLMSMLTMVGILAGMWVAGQWFDFLLAKYNAANGEAPDNAWRAALIPMLGAGAASIFAIVLGFAVQRTPSHPDEPFSKTVPVRHFVHLRQLFADRTLRYTALFTTFYWFIANFLGLEFVQFAKELYPEAGKAGRMSATASMLFAIGGGLMVGSTMVSILSRHRIRISFAPLGGIGMALGLFGIGSIPPASPGWYLSLGFLGFASGFYVVPLNAWIQDQARDDHRARVISALNLMTSFSGVLAIVCGIVLKQAGLNASMQVLLFGPAMLLVTWMLHRFLRHNAPSS